MTAFQRDIERRVVPSWLAPSMAMIQGELGSLRHGAGPLPGSDAELGRAERDWIEKPTLAAAVELLSTSIVLRQPAAARLAAAQILADQTAPETVREAARQVLGENGEPSAAEAFHPSEREQRLVIREAIAELKSSVRRDPRQAIRWTELARQHEALGQEKAADSAMRIALAVAPQDRFVLRAASRLALEHHDPEKGHAVLARATRTPHDPWLVAAEIAMSSVLNRPSRLIKHGRQMLDSNQFSAGDTSELASALGTEELQSGRRQARRLFEQALREPTQNAVAQARWASVRLPVIELTPEHLLTPGSFEARAWSHAEQGEWKSALENCWSWLETQPFSGLPGVLGSYEATLGEDFDSGVAIARAAIVANPTDVMLHNNLAVCLLQTGRVAEAEVAIERMRLFSSTDEEAVFLKGIQALRAYKIGNADEGRRLYREAEQLTVDPRVRASAAIARAREEVRAQTTEALGAATEALSVVKASESDGNRVAGFAILLARLIDELRALEATRPPR